MTSSVFIVYFIAVFMLCTLYIHRPTGSFGMTCYLGSSPVWPCSALCLQIGLTYVYYLATWYGTETCILECLGLR